MISTVEAESAAYNQVTPAREALRKVVVVLLTAALGLTLVSFLRSGANPAWLLTLLEAIGLDGVADAAHGALLGESGNVHFNRLVMFVLVTLFGFVVMPLIAITLILREPVRSYGLGVKGIGDAWRPYLWLFVLIVPLLVVASFSTDFQFIYPFYDIAPDEAWWPFLWLWWALYAVQFFAVEFMFRGFMVHGLKLRLGFSAIFVMVVPYTMIHFQKPLPEALAAIVGGIVLGYLSLKNGSIWWGVALHVAVAGTMDVLALAQAGLLG